jgi:hypothetical protein
MKKALQDDACPKHTHENAIYLSTQNELFLKTIYLFPKDTCEFRVSFSNYYHTCTCVSCAYRMTII